MQGTQVEPGTSQFRRPWAQALRGQSLAYVYSREMPDDAQIANVLTEDEARRIVSNIAKLPTLLAAKCH